MKRTNFSLIEYLVVGVLVAGVLGLAWAIFFAPRPENYSYDPMTQTQTWTDKNGNNFIQGPDGSTRQVR